MLALGASLERASEHPLAAAIVAAARGERSSLCSLRPISRRSPARACEARSSGRTVAIGNRALLQDLAIEPGAAAMRKPRRLRGEGQTVMFVAIDGRPAGLIGVADPIKDSTPEAIRALHEEGLQIVMLTGDSKATAEAVARKLGIDHVTAEVLPEQKDRGRQATAGARSRSSRWRATASTMRRRSRRPRSASRWEPAPMSRWRARASRWSKAICAASCARAA